MLKTRVISAVAGLLLLIAVVFLGKVTFGLFVFVLSIIGLHEFYKAVEHDGYQPIKSIGYFSGIALLAITLNGIPDFKNSYEVLFQSANFAFLLIYILIIALFGFIIFEHKKHSLNDIALTLFGIFYVIFLFSFLLLIRNLENGIYLIWLAFIGAFATDTFAYFTGVNLGKTKFLPEVSPNKSLEGAVGGIVGCILVMLAYGVWLNSLPFKEATISVYHFIILGILCGILSQIGDWGASSIKRYMKIKDYGSVMPGHGGVLDRFDSILFIAPVVYYYLNFIVLQ